MYVEPSIPQKQAMVESFYAEFNDFPVFSIVEFNMWGACNRRCSFCPVSMPEVWTNRHEGISTEDYEKVLKDLAAIDFQGTILWSTFSEPLLHKEARVLASITKRVLPRAKLHVVTNGDVIRKRGDFLLDLFKSGIDKIQVSLYDGEDQYQEFLAIGISLSLTENQWELRRRYSNGENFGLTISNRSGIIDSNKYRSIEEDKIMPEQLPLKSPCTYFFYQVVIDYDGAVLLCAHDWRKELVVGNAFGEDIWKIWTSSLANDIRLRLIGSDRGFKPCITCDVKGNLIGRKHFKEIKSRLKK